MTAAARVGRLRTLRRYDEAEREARQALAADPGDTDVLTELAAVLLAAGRFTDGLAAADAAVALAPEHEWPHRVRAHLLSRLDRHREAVEAGYVAVTLAPQEPVTARGYATVLQRAGRLDDAMRVALHAVALDPESAEAHLRVADIAADRGDQDTARRAYTTTLRLDPQNAAARHDLAVLDLNARHPARALRGLVDAGRLDPASPFVLPTVTALLWRVSWRIRIWMLAATWFTFVLTGSRLAGPDWSGRIAGLAVLATTAGLAWWSTRGLPRQALPVARAALRRDRPLTLTYAAIALCVLLYLAVAVTGQPAFAVFVLVLLMFLGLLSGGVGIVRRLRARRG